MRFETTLQRAVYQPWKDEYLDYHKLKVLLREDDSAPGHDDSWTDEVCRTKTIETLNGNGHDNIGQRTSRSSMRSLRMFN